MPRNPVVRVVVNDQEFKTMLDTGATLNLMEQGTFEALLSTFAESERPQVNTEACHLRIIAASGDEIKALARTWLQVELGGSFETVPIVIVKDLQFPCVLGTEYFFRFNSLTFNWKRKLVKLGELLCCANGRHISFAEVASWFDKAAENCRDTADLLHKSLWRPRRSLCWTGQGALSACRQLDGQRHLCPRSCVFGHQRQRNLSYHSCTSA